MTISDDQFKGMHAALGARGGFTANSRTGEPITTGISVAPWGNEKRIAISESTGGSIAKYHAANAERFVAPRNASLGGWRSDTHDVLDTPTVYKDKPAGHTAARKNMILSGQEAAFHLQGVDAKGDQQGVELFNPFHPAARASQKQEPDEFADMGFPYVGGHGDDKFDRVTDPAKMTPEQHIDRRRRAELQMQQPEVQAWVNSPKNRALAAASTPKPRSAPPQVKRTAR